MIPYLKIFALGFSLLVASTAHAASITVSCSSEDDGAFTVTKELRIQETNNSHSFFGSLGKTPSGIQLNGAFDLYPQNGLIYIDQVDIYGIGQKGKVVAAGTSGSHIAEGRPLRLSMVGGEIADPEGLQCSLVTKLDR